MSQYGMSDASEPNFERDTSLHPYTQESDPYSIERLVASHPIFSRLSLIACKVIQRECELREYQQYQQIYSEDEMYNSLFFINYRDDRVIFILDGIISIHKRHYGKIAKVSTASTLGEDQVLDVKPT